MEIDTSSLINIIVVLIIGCGVICSFFIWRHDRTKIALELHRKLQKKLIELMRLSELYTEVRDNAQNLNEANRKLNSVKNRIDIVQKEIRKLEKELSKKENRMPEEIELKYIPPVKQNEVNSSSV
jgi:peptidoglycan hydrolase CwlO-like protein